MGVGFTPADRNCLEAVASLFGSFGVHRGHFGSVLTGALPGSLLVDEWEDPSWALIMPSDGFAYLACQGDPGPFVREWREIVEMEAAGGCLELIVDDDAVEAKIGDIFGAISRFEVPRLAFLAPLATGEGGIETDLAAGLRFVRSRSPSRIDVGLFERGVEIGHCGGWVYGGEVETDIRIDESRRGQGLGTRLGQEYIKACAEDGLSPRWSCWEDKEESVRLARRLGFRGERVFKVHIHEEG